MERESPSIPLAVRFNLITAKPSPRLRHATLRLTHLSSAVRGAMVGVMLAGTSPQSHQYTTRATSPLRSSPGLVEEDADSVNSSVGDSAWRIALAAVRGSGALPRDPSTCVLWCAIALGALVRGVPLDHVGAAKTSCVVLVL